MKKKIGFIISFCIILTCMAIMLPAHATYTEGIYTYEVCNGNATITDCSSPSGEITIPSELGGYPVTSIGDSAFEYCSALASVTIPEGVTSIGSYAFYNCSSLIDMSIPSSVTNIGNGAFYYCENLQKVNLSDIGSWYNIEFGSFGASPFNYAKNLYLNGELVTDLVIPGSVETINNSLSGVTCFTSVSISEGVTNIGENAFYNCKGIRNIFIPEGVSSIGDGAFSSCESLASITIPGSVTSIGDVAFSSCKSLASVTIQEGVSSIGRRTFYYCSSLTEITIPKSITEIASETFKNCNKLQKVNLSDISAWYSISFEDTYSNPFSYAKELYLNGELVTDLVIPGNVKTINNSLSGVTSFTSVSISEGVTSIGEHAFENCTGMKSISIPTSLTSIKHGAFNNCENLQSVNLSDIGSWYNIGSYEANPFDYAKNLYLNDELVTDLVIPGNVETINNSLAGVTSFISVSISEGVTNIGYNAFSNCSSLTDISIPSSVTKIGEDAFYNCKNLQKVNLSDIGSWYNIDFGYYANPFNYAKNLYLNGELVTDLVIPGSVETINNSLSGVTCFTSVSISEGVTNIGENAFSGCNTLASISIPSSIKSIGYSAFYDCRNLKILNISDIGAWYNIEFGGYMANPFYITKDLYLNGEHVTDLVIPDGVTSLNSALAIGANFKSVTIPESVVKIGASTFYGYTGTTDITIPKSVKSIDDNAFYNCDNLKSVHISDMTAWCQIDFGNDAANPLSHARDLYLNGKQITDLVIPDGVTNIKNYAFYHFKGLTNITFSDSVTSIGAYAFEWCSGLTDITIPDSVTDIGKYAFYGCSGLTDITIPKSVKSIGDSAFYDCSHLSSVHISGMAAWCGINFENSYANPLAYAENLYLNDELVTDLVIPKETTSIADYAFCDYKKLSKVTISENVETIGSNAFSHTGLQQISIPKSVKQIDYYAFYYCQNLKNVYISDMAAWCGINFESSDANPLACAENLYLNNELVTDLVIPKETTSIADYAFCNYKKLSKVTISENVETIGSHAFSFTELQQISIPKSVKQIGYDAFSYCQTLKNVYISDMAAWCEINFESSDANPLACAENLYLNNKLVKNLIIPDGVTTIGRYAFYHFKGLTNITFSDSVKEISIYAFSGCSELTKLVLPKNLTHVYDYAFYKCANISSITLNKGIEFIGYGAFAECINCRNIYYGGTKEDWDNITVYSNALPSNAIMHYYTGVTGISLDYEAAEIAEGKTLHLTAAIVPEDATNKNVIWTTSNEDVAVVNDGYVTAVGAGDAVITATTEDRGYTAQCRITVKGSTSAEYFIFDNGCIKKYLGTAEEVIIPNAINGINVTEIGASAFENSTVKSVTLPYCITSIGDRAFFGSSLTELYFNGTTNDWKNISIGTDAIPDNAVIHCETGVTSISLDKEEIVTAPGEQTSLTATVTPENAVNKKIIWSTSNENVAVVENGIVTAVSFGEAVITATSEDGAYTASCNVKVYTAAWKFSFQNGSITRYNGNDSIVIVPDTIDGIAVKSIGNDAFNGCTIVTSVTLPEGLVSIGISAFEDCSNLTDISIPLSVKSIGSSAFRNTGLSSVTLPEGLVSIEYNTFSDCRNLTDVKLPSTLKSIGRGSFYNCGITEISLPDSVASIGSYAFSDCSALTEINIPDRVTRIENSTFYDCKNLKNIYMSDNIAAIDEQAFTDCANLEDITLPKSVTSIGKFAFEGCTSLRNVHIYDMSAFVQIYSQGYSSSPLTYAENLYLKGAKVTDLVIPEGIKKVEGIFTRFSGFNSITFPKSLNYLGRNEFSSCKNLNAVYISDLAAWCNIDFNGSNPLSIAKNLYLNGNLVTDLVIPGGVTDIKSCAFENCTSVKRVTIGGNVGYIGERAFYGCPISTLDIPYNVHYISSNAFGNCTSLTEVSIGNGTARLEGAFNGCTSLKNITVDGTNASYASADGVLYSKWQTEIVAFPPMSDIKVFEVPYGITEIPAYAFSNCKNLKRVILPDSITSIEKNAFYNCLTLENVNIPKKVTSIGEYAFCYCSNLKNIVLPDGIDTIADSVFNGCSSLTEIAIPDSVAKIGNYAFGSCRSLSEVTVPDGVTSIGNGAFNYCDNLQKIVIPASVTYIGDLSENHAEIWVDEKNETYSSLDGVLFNKAGTTLIHYPSVNSRTEYAIPDGVKTISYEAFCNSNFTAVTIPKSVTYITSSAFSNCNKLTDVYYGGTKADRGTLGTDNNILQRCTWHYTDGTEEGTGIPKIKAVGTTALPGGTAKVDIVIENNPGVAMVGFNLNYNSALELQSMKNGSIFDGNDIIAGNINKKPYVFTCVNGNTNKNTDGVLVSAIFKVKDDCEPGDYGIYLSQFEIYDINEHKIDFFADKAAVNVSTGDTHGINIIADIPQKDGTVIASLYDAADRLIRTKMYEPSDALNISFDESGAYVKIMQWNMETLEPFTKERTIDVAGNPQTALSISVPEYTTGGKIVIALYDAADRLVNTKIFAAAETINASFSENGAYVKIMHLSDDMITPLEPSRYITVADNT